MSPHLLLNILKYIPRKLILIARLTKDLSLSLIKGSYLREILPQATFSSANEPRHLSSLIEEFDRILILIPGRNVRPFLANLIDNLLALSYPANLIDIGFLEGDSTDGSYEYLSQELPRLREKFHSASLLKKDFHYQPRHKKRWLAKDQLLRRSTIAKARNHLLQKCLQPAHKWVLWIDADVQYWPDDIIQQLLAYKKQILAPHCVDDKGKTFDLNSFKYVDNKRRNWLSYAKEELLQPPVGYGRKYLGDFAPNILVALDGVGATMLLVAAAVHNDGVHFPEETYQMHIETEGFAFLARAKGYECWGTSELEIIHPRY